MEEVMDNLHISAAQRTETVPLSSTNIVSRASRISPERYQEFVRAMAQVMNSLMFHEVGAAVAVETVIETVNSSRAQEEVFADEEALAALERMTDENKVYLSEGKIYKI